MELGAIKYKKAVLLSIVSFLLINISYAQKYWVGGSGDWHNKNHWSLTSGGQGGAAIPTGDDDVIFDEHSFSSSSDYITVTDIAFAKDLDFSKSSYFIELRGASSSRLIITGEVNLNHVTNKFEGRVDLLGMHHPYNTTTFNPGDFVGLTSLNSYVNSSKAKGAQTLLVTDITFNVTDATCGNDGAVTASLVGGVGPFRYEWFPGDPTGDGTPTVTNLAPNTYSLLVTDSSDMQGRLENVVVGGNLPLVPFISGSNNISCNGADDGSITASQFQGTAPYTYLWDDGAAQTTQTAINLAPGTYSVTITDANGCSATTSTVTLTEPDALVASIAGQTNLTCNSVCSGTATGTATGGTTPYSYSWYDSPVDPGVAANTGMCAGTFNVRVTDANGCTSTAPVTLTEPTQLVGGVTSTNVTCNGANDGTGTASESGGTGPYTYSWYDAPGTPTSAAINSLAPGTYNCEITDANGCRDTVQITITEPAVLNASISAQTNILCNGDATGSATATKSGGTDPVVYTWYDAPGTPNGATLSNVVAGTYNVEVRDANGCLDTAQVTLTEPLTAVAASIAGQTNNVCFGACAGDATGLGADGTGPYTYSWYDAPGTPTTLTAPNLCAGTFNFEVTDANGCRDTAQVTITEPTELTGSMVKTDALCFGVCNGTATVTPSGGTGSKTLDWYDVPGTPTTAAITGLCAGTFNVEIRDANACLDTVSVTIDQPTDLVASISASTNVACFSECTGSASATSVGGTNPVTYDWYDAPGTPTTPTASNLCAGTFNVEITDANGCLDTAQVIITQPATAVSSSITGQTNNICFGGCAGDATVAPANGTPGYVISWYDVPGTPTTLTATSLCAGTFNVEVTDANGCRDTSQVTITQPAAGVSVTISDTTHLLCNSICIGEAVAAYNGGTGPYTLDWYTNGNATTDTVKNLCAGTYSVEVTDANGCLDTADVTITQPNVLTVSIAASTNVTCNGADDGTATASGSGGVAPYTYSWYDAPGTPTTALITGLAPGTYNVEITDANGCLDTAQVSITEPVVLVASIASSTNVACKGVCTGAASPGVVGGTGPYSYSWYDSPGTPTSANLTGMCAGTYNVEITDANGCLDTAQVIITEPALALSAAITSSTNVMCNNVCNGDAAVTPTGGTTPYTYSWDDPGTQTDSLATGLCAGTFTGTITDANGCTANDNVTLTQPGAMTFTMDSVTTICNGSSDGLAIVNVSGGVTPYVYKWYTAGNVNNDTAVTFAGNHSVEITDANGCRDTGHVEVLEPPILNALISTSINVSCYSYADGSATATPTGGVTPYTYSWYTLPGSPTTVTVNSLDTGTYYLELTDSLGCKDTGSVTIAQPDTLVLMPDSIPVSCRGLCDGQANANVTGGTPGFTYSWFSAGAGGQTTATANSLCAGTYDIAVVDANGCRDTAQVVVTQPAADMVTVPIDFGDATCFGGSDAWAAAAGTGGTSPYTYWWSDPLNQTNDTATGLAAGSYQVTAIDSRGCTDTIQMTVGQPSEIVGSGTQTNLTCQGVCIGNASITGVVGGSAPYTHQWSNGGVTTSISNLCAGVYADTITDAVGCRDTVVFTISEPDTIQPIISDTTHVSCFGGSDGMAVVSPTGGTGAFTFDWYDAGNVTNDTLSNLSIGTYNVEVTDANGCRDTGTVTITQPTVLDATTDSTEATCSGICTGTATVTPTGGTSPYTYSWYSAGAGAQTTQTATTLCADTFYVEITDANGCLDTAQAIVTQPVTLTASVEDFTDATCYGGSDGWGSIAETGGTGPYTYWWSDPLNQTNDTATGLTAAVYRAAVIDANGCSDTVNVNIGQPFDIVGDTTATVSNVSCFGACDASILMAPNGGTPPYTHSWNTGSSATNLSNLCPATYVDTITDSRGCLDTATFVITEPAVLTASMLDTVDATCFGSTNGILVATQTGGTGPYTYDWYDAGNVTNDTLTAGAGTYNVEITDANGCRDTATGTISQPTDIVSTTDSTEATCSGICNGTATVTPTGGNGPYTYSWYSAGGGGQTTPTATALCADTFYVEVTDASGCTDTAQAIVTQPVTVVTTLVDRDSATCFGSPDGWAAVSGSGGNGPYTYWWSDASNQTNDTATGLAGGTYQAVSIDANGCTDTLDVNVLQPNDIVNAASINHVSCKDVCDANIKAVVTGGTGAYTHSWSTGSVSDSIFGLCDGTYTDTITDAYGCKDTTTFTVTEPDSLLASIADTTHVLCNPQTTGLAVVTQTGGTAPFTYDWYDAGNVTNDSLMNVGAGTYNVEVTDANGCLDTATVTITQPTLMVVTTDTVEPLCNGDCNGRAWVTATGGISGYTYDWLDAGNAATDTVNNLCAGNYNVEVTDANGCRDTALAIVTQPLQITASIQDSSGASCNSGNDGWASVTQTGGTAPYTYWWSDPLNQTNDTATGLTPGTYQVAVTDANGCSDTTTVTVLQPTAIVSTPTITHPLCNGDCNGTVSTAVSGGVGPYTHSWSTGSNLSAVVGLCDGVYADTITDANGCRDTMVVTLIEPAVLAANLDSTDVSCFGGTNGTAFSLTSGGTGPYTYEWNDPSSSTNDTITGLTAGTYQIIVTDANACKDTDSVVVNQPLQLTSSITDTTHVNCLCTGVAITTPVGGTAPYTYLWNDPSAQTDSTATALCAGSWEVEITDANGCLDTSFVTIRDTSNFTASITDTTHTTCFGSCDGVAIVTPSQGIAPYTFSWNNPAATTDSTVTGLCAGSYFATVTDAIGCVRMVPVTITQPAAVAGNPSFTQPLCFGDTNGIAWMTPTGGTGPYTHSWTTGSSNDSIFNLGIGTYTDTITDSRGCLDTAQVTVTQPTILNGALDSNNVQCFNAADGYTWVVASGGTSPYTYEWNDPSTSTNDTAFNLAPGIYTVIVTDANACKDTDSISITQPTQLTSSITDTNHVACTCTGTATVTPAGGTAPYTYLWNNPSAQTDSTATGLCAGNWRAIVTDANGCTDTSFVTIQDTSSFTATITDTTMVNCYGACTGGAIVTPANGVLPYSYLWNDLAGTTDSTVTNLCAGNYTVTVQDGNLCTRILPITIYQPDSLILNLAATNITCKDSCDGFISPTLTGGVAPYTYAWDDPLNQTTPVADSLCPNIYTLTVTDSNGCTVATSLGISEPNELIAFLNPVQQITCNNDNDGSITVVQTGGTGPYTYSWNTGPTTQTISSLSAGTYTATVTDVNGCTDDSTAVIVNPLPLTSSITNFANILCGGQATGTATVTPFGGTAPYTFDWFDAPGSQTDSTAINLPAGTYRVAVTDDHGCTDTSTITLTEPTVFNPVQNVILPTSCTVCDGAASVSVSGGVLPYTFDWYTDGGQVSAGIASLCAGIHSVEVSDANGCTDTVHFNITGPGGLTAGISSIQDVSCNGADDAYLVGTGVAGTAPYTYSWNDPSSQATDTAKNLAPGVYQVTVTDANGCIAFASGSVVEPNVLVTSLIDTNASACSGACTGTALIGVTGGTGPYTYSWNDPATQTTANPSALCPGIYIGTATDANGCTDTALATIAGPNNYLLTIDSVVNVTINGLCNGNASVTASGGTPGYTYVWNDPGTTANKSVNNLCPGAYTATVTDNAGCVATANITITQPPALVATIIDSSDARCFAQGSGYAEVSYTGGVAPYTVSWNDPSAQTTDIATSLVAGTYTVTVTDANGAVATDQVTIGQPTQVVNSIDAITHVTCTGFCTGAATVSSTGGTGPYTYLWQTGNQATNSPVNLCVGYALYSVTDATGCIYQDSVQINDLNALTNAMTGTNVTCNSNCDGTISTNATGGVGALTHRWNTGSTATSLASLCPGTYIDTVTDANGCFFVDSVIITEPAVFAGSIIDSTNLTCFGVCNGTAIASATGGTQPYQFTWTNSPGNQVNDTAFNLCAQAYYLLAQDANGCSFEDTVTLTQPSQITITNTAQSNATCFNLCNGSATVNASGGTGTLAYSWSHGPTTPSISSLCDGNYTVTVTDDSSCTANLVVTITEPTAVSASIVDTTHILCLSAPTCDGNATAGATGGTGPYTYLWYDASNQTNAQATSLCVGTYNVEVTDANLCKDTAQVTINSNSSLTATLSANDISCNGLCDGNLKANPVGGVAPFTYSWNTGSTADSISGLCGGSYFVTVTDNAGCSYATSGFISEPTQLNASIGAQTNLNCFGVCEGTATAAGNGGTAPYTYAWNDPAAQTNQTATGLCEGAVQVVITDANGCQDSSTTTLTQPAQLTSLASATQTSCTNTSTGTITLTPNGGTAPYTYAWTGPGAYSSTSKDLIGLGIGMYNVTVTDANGCTRLDSSAVSEIVTILADAGNDTTLCEGDSITLTATGGANYAWDNGVNTNTNQVKPSSTSTYIVTVTNSGCTDYDTVTVNVNPNPTALITSTDNLILTGNSAQLAGTGAGQGGSYSWDPPLTLSDPTLANPIATPQTDTKYTLTVTNSFGCSDTVSTTIKVAETIVFPDGITPNGDGLNDVWRILLIEEYPDAVVEVYNRWGQMVFRNVGYTSKWDGMQDGKELPVGTYYYVIDLGKDKGRFTGPITLMR